MTTTSAEHSISDEEERQPLVANLPAGSVVESAVASASNKEEKASSSGSFFLKIVFLLLGDFLANADDGFFIAVYERIASEYQQSDQASWLVLVTSIFYSIVLPIYGVLGDRHDSKKIILSPYLLFMVGNIVPVFASPLWLVTAGRLVACVGGSGLYSMTAIVVADNAKPSDVGVLRSYAVVAAFLGRNSGPIFGGLLTDALGWRKAFLCQVPVAFVCAGIIAFLFDSKKTRTKKSVTEQPYDAATPKQEHSMDLFGILLYAVVITAFTFLLKSASGTDGIWFSLGSAIILVTFSATLYRRERNLGSKAFVPASVFTRSLGTQFIIQMIWVSGTFSALVTVPIYAARVENATTAGVALHLIPMAACSTIGNLLGSRIIKITKHYKFITHIGVFVGAGGFFVLAFVWQGPLDWGRSLLIAFVGLAGGLVNASTFMAITINSAEGQKGAIVGFFFLAAELGCLIGAAWSSVVTGTLFAQGLQANAPFVSRRQEIIFKILRDSKFTFTLPKAWQIAAIASFVKAWKVYCLIAGTVAVMLQPLILTIVEKPIE